MIEPLAPITDAAAHEEEDSEDVLRRCSRMRRAARRCGRAFVRRPRDGRPRRRRCSAGGGGAWMGDPAGGLRPSFDPPPAASVTMRRNPLRESAGFVRWREDARPFSLSDALGVEAPAAPQRDEPGRAARACALRGRRQFRRRQCCAPAPGCGAAPIRAPACRQTAAGRDSFVRRGGVRREAEGRRARGLPTPAPAAAEPDPFGTFGVERRVPRSTKSVASGSHRAKKGRRSLPRRPLASLWLSAFCLRGGF
ncbi:MAG: hypothetical protein ACLT98_15330 [Eggerthellaceae bacterium]